MPHSHQPLRSIRWAVLWSGAAVLACAAPAWAVVPGLAGPLQALMQLLPQILPFLAAGLAGLFSSKTWRARMGGLVRWLGTARGMAFACVFVSLCFAGALLYRPGDRSRAAAAVPAVPAPGGTEEWPMFGGNLARTGRVRAGSGGVEGVVKWIFTDPEAGVADLASSPAVVGNRIYTGSAQASVFDTTGMVYCVDANTGKRIWQFQTAKQVFSSPAVVKGRVYVGEGLHTDLDCKVYCLDAATGKKLWATPTRSHTESNPAVVGNRVFIGAGDDGIYSLDATTGKVVWHQRHGHIDTAPAITGGKLFAGTGYGALRALALEAATGRVVWETRCDLPVWGAPAVADGKVYFGIGNGDFVKSAPHPAGAIWCLNAATGKQLWRYDLPDAVVTSVALTGELALAGCRDGRLYAVDRTTGKRVWSAPCGGPVVASPATDGTLVYAASGGGQVTALDVASGKSVWALDLRPLAAPDLQIHSSPALSGSRLYLGTSSSRFFSIGR